MEMGTWVELFIRAVFWAEPFWFPILLCNLLPHLHSNARQLFASYWFSQMGKHLFNFIHFNGAFDLHLERGREYVKSGHSFRELIIETGVHVLGGSFQYLFAFYYFLLLVYFSIPPLSSAMRKWLVSMKASFWKHNVLITTMWMKLAQWASFS